MSNSVVDQALDILVAGQDFTALRRALFATVAGHYLESESSAAPPPDQENYKVFALNALLARLPTCSLAAVTTITKGKTGIKDAVPGPFPLVVTAEARGSSDHFDFEGPGVMIPMVSSTGHGDASLKRVHFQDGQYAVGSILAVVQPKDTQQLSARYLHAYLSTFKDELLVSRMVGTANVSLTVAKIGDVPVPLLPISAQRKVDELMALCDRLEAQQADAESAHAQLVQALLDSLTQASDATDFAANWQRLAEHFHTLFTTEPSIDALKKTLLQLAVMGKLVPQDPSDEPADELLGKIAKEIAQLHSEGKIRTPKTINPVSTEDAEFEAPQGWKWLRLSQITRQLGDGLHGTPIYSQGGGYYFVNGNNLKEGKIVIKPETKTVSEAEYSKHKKPLDEQSILVSINGTIGNVAFYNSEKIVLGKSACYFNLASGVSKHFVRLLIEAPGFMKYALKSATGTTIKNLGLKAMNDYPIALPPLAEQHRIVAKVDQLIALCDQLKTRLTQARQLNEQLASTLVEQAVA